MSSMSLPKTLIFNFSRAFPQSQPSLPFHSKVSPRVCFSSASKYSEGRHAGEVSCNKTPWTSSSVSSDSDIEEKANKVKDKAADGMKETVTLTREKSEEMKQKVQGKAEEMKESAKETTGQAAEKAEEMKESATEKAYDMREKTNEAAEKAKEGTYRAGESVAEKTKEGMEKAKEGTHRAGESVAEKTKEGTEKTKEETSKAAETVKETVEGAWEGAKGTGQKIKEAVVGKGEEVDDYLREASEEGGKRVDEEVEKLRSKAGGNDSGKGKY